MAHKIVATHKASLAERCHLAVASSLPRAQESQHDLYTARCLCGASGVIRRRSSLGESEIVQRVPHNAAATFCAIVTTHLASEFMATLDAKVVSDVTPEEQRRLAREYEV